MASKPHKDMETTGHIMERACHNKTRQGLIAHSGAAATFKGVMLPSSIELCSGEDQYSGTAAVVQQTDGASALDSYHNGPSPVVGHIITLQQHCLALMPACVVDMSAMHSDCSASTLLQRISSSWE